MSILEQTRKLQNCFTAMEDDRRPILASYELDSPTSAPRNSVQSYDACQNAMTKPSIALQQGLSPNQVASTVPVEPFGCLYASFITINTLVGGGMLTFPAAVHKAGGVLPFIVLILVTGIIALINYMVIGVAAQRIATRGFDLSYGQLTTTYFGSITGTFASVLLIIASFGNMTAYIKAIYGFIIVIIKSFSSEFLDNHPSLPYWGAIMVFLVVIFPMCFVRTVGKLKRVSAVMALNILYVVGIAIAFWIIRLRSREHFSDECGELEWSPKMILEALPPIFFAFAGTILASNVGAGLEPKGTRALLKTTVLACGFTVACYIIVGVCLYSSFRCSLRSNLFLMLPEDEFSVVLGTFLYLIKLSCEFPIYWHFNKLSLMDLLSKFRSFKGWEQLPLKAELRTRTILSFVITSVAVVCALVTPDLYYLVTLSGLAWLIIAFIIPPMLYSKITKETIRLSQKRTIYWSKIVLTYIWVAVMIALFLVTVAAVLLDFKNLV